MRILTSRAIFSAAAAAIALTTVAVEPAAAGSYRSNDAAALMAFAAIAGTIAAIAIAKQHRNRRSYHHVPAYGDPIPVPHHHGHWRHHHHPHWQYR